MFLLLLPLLLLSTLITCFITSLLPESWSLFLLPLKIVIIIIVINDLLPGTLGQDENPPCGPLKEDGVNKYGFCLAFCEEAETPCPDFDDECENPFQVCCIKDSVGHPECD